MCYKRPDQASRAAMREFVLEAAVATNHSGRGRAHAAGAFMTRAGDYVL
jgi:hypothetical protein